jgi:hypothetical protein
MRFFSSDRNESNDDQSNVDVQNRSEELNPDQAHDEHPERVSSDPVAVPQQRTGSPWADAPGTSADDSADAELADTERADGTDERPPFHEPGPQPTAFGASTVGGAVAASAVANQQNDRWDVTDRDTDAASGVADDRSVAHGDGVVADDASPWATGPDGAAERVDERDRPGGFADERGDVDGAMEDRGTFDDPHVRDELADTGGPDPTPPDAAVETVATTDQTDRREPDADRVEGEPALRDEGGFDDPTAVDPATRQPLDTDTVGDRETDSAAGGAAAGAAAGAVAADRATGPDTATPAEDIDTGAAPATATAAGTAGTADRLPGSVAAPSLGSLFGESDAQTFHERWREVQLKFVDDPKDATRDAAGLLDEALDKLSANLRAQKDSLTNESDDTEQLRVQLRGYRDMINRILDL